MFFSVKELEQRKVYFDVSFPPGEIEFSDTGLQQLTNLDAEGSAELLANTQGEIRVQGKLKVAMEAECDRCLEPARFPIAADFDLFYSPAIRTRAYHAAEEVALHEGEIEIAFYQGGGLELEDMLREQIMLLLPMQRICSEDCRGICPECGKDRNVNPCHCQARTNDDRWEALKKLNVRGI